MKRYVTVRKHGKTSSVLLRVDHQSFHVGEHFVTMNHKEALWLAKMLRVALLRMVRTEAAKEWNWRLKP